MGLLGAKRIWCAAGVWTKIIASFGRGYHQDFRVSFMTGDNRSATGTFLERRCLWIIPQKPVEGPIADSMTFHREWINGIYSVRVRLDVDGWATID